MNFNRFASLDTALVLGCSVVPFSAVVRSSQNYYVLLVRNNLIVQTSSLSWIIFPRLDLTNKIHFYYGIVAVTVVCYCPTYILIILIVQDNKVVVVVDHITIGEGSVSVAWRCRIFQVFSASKKSGSPC